MENFFTINKKSSEFSFIPPPSTLILHFPNKLYEIYIYSWKHRLQYFLLLWATPSFEVVRSSTHDFFFKIDRTHGFQSIIGESLSYDRFNISFTTNQNLSESPSTLFRPLKIFIFQTSPTRFIFARVFITMLQKHHHFHKGTDYIISYCFELHLDLRFFDQAHMIFSKRLIT